MSEEKKENSRWMILRVVIALIILIIGVFRHLYGWEDVAGGLLESRLVSNLQSAFILIHVVTVLELIFLVWTLAGKLNNWYFLSSVLFGVLYTLSFIIAFNNESYANMDLTAIYNWSGYPLAVLILPLTFWVTRDDALGNKRLLPLWFQGAIIVVLFGGYLGYYYPSHDQMKDLGNDYNVKYANWEPYWKLLEEKEPSFLEKDNYIIGFFSVTCSHCNAAARRIGVYQTNNPDVEIIAVFFGKSADEEFWSSNSIVDEFMERNNASFPYLKMIDYEAISISDNQFPVIVEMKENKPSRIYVGEELNLWAFDHLFGKN